MRLFIALWPDAATALELTSWAHDAQALCGGRLMQPADMHLTLAFLGQVSASQVSALTDMVSAWQVELHPFALQRFGMFQRARVVWAGPTDAGDLEWLQGLYDTLWCRLRDLGLTAPEQAFTPHISLLRGARPGSLDTLQRAPWVCTPVRCVLVASSPTHDSTHYQVLAQAPECTHR